MSRHTLRGTDRLIHEFDRALRTLAGVTRSARDVPGANLAEGELGKAERRQAAALMRVNHTGEICAQALYSGQALTASNPVTRDVLEKAAAEETEHLAWTASRVEDLGGHLSMLNPVFYAGAFTVGLVAGAMGERWNLGFLAETERQVEAHLDGHLDRLPADDRKSRAVVAQMKEDEAGHAATASAHGAAELPSPVKRIMKLAAHVMTSSAYRI